MTTHDYVHEALPGFLTGEDPQTRLTEHGPEHLRDAELLALTLGIKPSKAQQIITDGLHVLNQPATQLRQHMSPRQASKLTATLELARRILQQGLGAKPCINGPADTLPHLTSIRDQPREHFHVLCLNARNQVTHAETTSIGSLSSSIVHPRDILGLAIRHNAASLILAHNHPSGDTTPSREDVDVTRRLHQAGEIIGISILDHIIISSDRYISMKEEGYL